ncbi:hypothetical protein OG244_34865 [Streptomyces brevispora]|uniref:hypothetical protein n=1 Tax=Streptomyces brevispora TaxID=887462 RepID=UPI002E3726BB|nr:hypothetical protein [Streptomyces brevispora]
MHLVAGLIAAGAIETGIGCGVESMSRVFLGAALTPDNGAPVPDDWSLDMPDQFTAVERIARNRGITSQRPPPRRRYGEANGGWRLAAGGWRLAAGGWRLAADHRAAQPRTRQRPPSSVKRCAHPLFAAPGTPPRGPSPPCARAPRRRSVGGSVTNRQEPGGRRARPT